ncbi:VaFE repeat-containing surface-anchored protein [Pimelobacter simplex]|uniref:VaFE repeat-containing surface-anchored protein n=1 Tax=Nocardioides simplex TaxID=2045 RepID=UPI003AAE253E
MTRARRTWVVGLVLAVSAVVMPSWTPSASATEIGPTVWVGPKAQGYPGTGIHGIYNQTPADPSNPGAPDFWGYCIEHDVSAQSFRDALVGDAADYLGTNHFSDPAIQGKVLWVLAHSYPALSLADFATAAGVPGISVNDAIEAAQYAIWRYTDLTFDANWNWSSQNSKDAYWYLVNGANASSGMTPGDLATTATITGPAGAQQAGTLVGPFTVHTNQPTASLSVAPSVTITDAAGTPINAAAVVDGQQVYLDLRGTTTAGSATVTVTASGSNATGKIVSVPVQAGGTPTAGTHAQTLVVVAPSTATVTDDAAVTWAAAPVPAIGTTLVDQADGDHTIPAGGGTVVDTVAYQNLTPGTQYTLTGELRKKSDGTATGITGTKTFTPASANGTVDVTFTVPAGYAGQQLVAFEELRAAGSPTIVAEHKDINDAAQTVSVSPAPSIGTTLVDQADGDHTIPAGGGTVVDTVAYQNLTPGTQYTLTGELRKKSDGSATGITGTKTFTPASANGTVDVTFTVPAGYAGQQLVAFEELRVAGSPTIVAEHKDINDAAQTVSVQPLVPAIGTTLVDQADGDHTIPAGGGTVVDTVAYQNLTPGTQYTLTGELRKKSDGSATGITGSKTFTPASASGTADVTFVVPAGFAGEQLVAFEELRVAGSPTIVAEHKDINDAAQTVSVEATTPGGPVSTVTLTTETSSKTVTPGTSLSDVVTIKGLVPGHGATGSATLYGPFASRAAMRCTPAHAAGKVAFKPANGVVRTPSVRVNRTGYYTWVASTTADSRNTAATHACGLASETTLVRKSPYKTPVVSTGFSSAGLPFAGRGTVSRISIPALKVNAGTSLVGIRKGAMNVPGKVARTGQLDRSAAAGDLIGTTVIAGHVSDRHDRPGAFWKLSKARPGQVVTVWQAGKPLRYRITSVQQFSRTKKLPARFFSTTGAHQLVLISCADRVRTSGGGFHYRNNVVVTATPIGG